VLLHCCGFLCYCIVCLLRGCDKFHMQQSLTDIGSMECVYVNVNVNVNYDANTESKPYPGRRTSVPVLHTGWHFTKWQFISYKCPVQSAVWLRQGTEFPQQIHWARPQHTKHLSQVIREIQNEALKAISVCVTHLRNARNGFSVFSLGFVTQWRNSS
jgi:hypothetical protein